MRDMLKVLGEARKEVDRLKERLAQKEASVAIAIDRLKAKLAQKEADVKSAVDNLRDELAQKEADVAALEKAHALLSEGSDAMDEPVKVEKQATPSRAKTTKKVEKQAKPRRVKKAETTKKPAEPVPETPPDYGDVTASWDHKLAE